MFAKVILLLGFCAVASNAAVVRGIMCEGCTLVGDALENFLKSPTVEQKVTDELLSFCAQIPQANLTTACAQVVNQYNEEIYAMIQNMLEPTNLCPEINMCDSTFHSLMARRNNRGIECSLCEDAMGWALGELQSTNILPKVLSYVEDVCSVFPSSYQAQCKQFLDTYGNQLITDILSELQPATACGDIGFC